MDITQQEKSIKKLFIGKCWEYLNDNFHKFSETNKIKVALELSKKSLPTQIQGEVQVVQMPSIVRVYETGKRPLEFKLG